MLRELESALIDEGLQRGVHLFTHPHRFVGERVLEQLRDLGYRSLAIAEFPDDLGALVQVAHLRRAARIEEDDLAVALRDREIGSVPGCGV